MPLAVDAEPQHEELSAAAAASTGCKDQSAADSAAGVPATSGDDQGLRRRDRHSFIKLLRDGVQRRVSEQLDTDAAEGAAAERRSSDGNTSNNNNSGSDDHQDPSLLPATGAKQRTRSRKSCGGAWQTLAWRDAYSTEPFFKALIDDKPLRIKQILQGELNGLGTGLTVGAYS